LDARLWLEVARVCFDTRMTPRRLVVGVTGASGVQYALDLLETLQHLELETHLVVSEGAKRVLAEELGMNSRDLTRFGAQVHDDRDVGAGIASGSFRTVGMVVIPCSASTLSKIALGLADTLITRAAHVHLKERRNLVLVPRETPYSRAMLESMLKAFDAGARILPANPGFYGKPQTVADILGFITARVLDQLGIENTRAPRWKDGA
jgi:flavin prenyltransferase